MARVYLGCAAVFGFVAVMAGAFGSHGLKGRLSPDLLDTYEIAVRYQMYHALALLAVAWLYSGSPTKAIQWAGVLFVVGVTIFSGTLYLLVLTGQRRLGAVTPLGGLALLAGWGCLIWSALSRNLPARK